VPQSSVLGRLLATADARLFGIAAHIDRMSRYAELIALQLGMADARARALRGAAKLHDFGKLATPDRILLKPGPLTAAERAVIQLHTVVGHQLLCDSGSELLDIAAEIALSHHERWDGGGYPQGLRGDEIPLDARIAALADVFDSLTRERPYRPAVRRTEALKLINSGRGTEFDPDVVDAFTACAAEIRRTRGAKHAPGRYPSRCSTLPPRSPS
jgi:HD-GYP domain-containing protein (c-di-GMP phosphodiesterase class II)